MSKSILFDYQAFTMQKYGGISRYFAALESQLSDYGMRSKLFLLYSENAYIQKDHLVMNSSIGHLLLKKRSRMERWNKRWYTYLLKNNKFDLFHPTHYDPYFLSYLQKPYVVTVHDMIHELFPEYFYPYDPTAKHKRIVVEKADHIIAISECTKKDLQEVYGIPDTKITVIHHGLFVNTEIGEGAPKRKTLEYPYVLFVGDRIGYKNFFRFTKALSEVMKKHTDLRLICAGGGALNPNEQEHLKRQKIEDRVFQIHASEDELRELYRNALFFCYPSLYEGFGLPILEAFANECAVLVSNTSCFREVGGDAVCYFDPYDVDDIAQKVEVFMRDTTSRKKMIELGKKRLELFSIASCINKTSSIYKSLIG